MKEMNKRRLSAMLASAVLATAALVTIPSADAVANSGCFTKKTGSNQVGAAWCDSGSTKFRAAAKCSFLGGWVNYPVGQWIKPGTNYSYATCSGLTFVDSVWMDFK